jgi:hypothetical protein
MQSIENRGNAEVDINEEASPGTLDYRHRMQTAHLKFGYRSISIFWLVICTEFFSAH